MTESRRLLQHFLAALAYRTQKALRGAPVPSENFIFARVAAANVGPDQPEPAAPDAWWRPDQPPQPPGPVPERGRVDA